MTLSATALAPIAAQMRIPAAALYTLPTVVEAFARKANIPVGMMAIHLLENAALRDYAATVCLKVYAEDRA